MFKLITPPGMLLTTALLVIYCVYAFLIGWIERSLYTLAGGLIAVVATYGVAMVRPWSRFLVYLLAGGFLAKLGISIYEGVRSGFYSAQVLSIASMSRSLVPAMLMVALSAVCCALVYLQFRPTLVPAATQNEASTKR